MPTAPATGRTGRGPLLLLLLVLVAFGGVVAAEHRVFHRVPDMIQATYMIGALDIVDDALARPLVDLTPYADNLGTRYYPPLLLHALALTFRVAGVDYASVLWLTLPLALLALVSLHIVGSAGGDRWTGLLAALLLASYPGFRSASAGIYMDHALACLIAAALAALVLHRARARLAPLAAFALASAAAWMTRWTFVLLPASALPLVLGEALFGTRERRRARAFRFLGILVASLLAALPFAVWLFARADVASLTNNVTAEPTRIPLLAQLAFYPRLIADEGTGIALALLAAVAVFHPAVWRSRHLWPALALLLGGLVFLVWLPPKQPRYALMLYPTLALVTAVAARSWRSVLVRRGLTAVVVILALGTTVLDLSGRRTAHPAFLERIVTCIEDDWGRQDTAKVLVHDRYYRLEGDLNAPVLIFVNAALGGGPKRFVEGLFEPMLVHGEGCWEASTSYDYVILPVRQVHRRSYQNDGFLTCMDLQRLAVFDLRDFVGENGEVTVYRVR